MPIDTAAPSAASEDAPMVSEHAIRAALAGGVSQAEWPKVVREVAQLARERRMGLQWEQGARARLRDAVEDVERLSDEVESLRGPARQWSLLVMALTVGFDEDRVPDDASPLLSALHEMANAEWGDDTNDAVVRAFGAAQAERDEHMATESPDGAATQQDGGGA